MCKEEADMWDVESREINIERVNHTIYFFLLEASKLEFNKHVCVLWLLPFTVNDLWPLK